MKMKGAKTFECLFLCMVLKPHHLVQVTYSRRQLHDAWTLAGMIVCAAVAKLLKAATQHSRC